MLKLLILVGLPGAGKTTWAKKVLERCTGVVLVSSDAIREMLYGRYDFRPGDEEMVRRIALAAMRYAFVHRCSVILDDSLLSLTAESRDSLVEYVRTFEPLFGKLEISAITFPRMPLEHLKFVRQQDPKGLTPMHWEHVINELSAEFQSVEGNECFDIVRSACDGFGI